MNYLKKLVGHRIYLSPVNSGDNEIIAGWGNDLEVAIYTGQTSDMISFDRQRDYLETTIRNGFGFLVVRNSDDHPMGYCRLKAIDWVNRKASIGIFIGDKTCWNSGYGTEATRLLLDFGFNMLNLRNIMLEVYSYNDRAIKAYQKCGFKEIGRRRRSIIYGGREYDEVYMDILAEEFTGELVEQILG